MDQPTLIAYFCKHCQHVVKGVSKGAGKRYSFSCPVCKSDVLYATARSLIHFFRIKEHSDNGKLLIEMQQEKLKQLGNG